MTDIDIIQLVTSTHHNITVDEMLFKTRKREIVQARQISMFFCKEFTKKSLAVIGMYHNNKDHATVMYAIRTVNNLCYIDNKVEQDVIEIREEIKNRLESFYATLRHRLMFIPNGRVDNLKIRLKRANHYKNTNHGYIKIKNTNEKKHIRFW